MTNPIEYIETCQIDRRFEHLRQRNSVVEKALFLSIASHSIRDPLQAIREPESDSYILLDGFKRLRCCLKLAISQIPAICLRTSEVDGICTLLRQKTSTSLTIFEQACLVDTLYTQYSLDLPEIASRLGRSRSWVSLRFHLMDEMSDIIRDKIVSGLFPVRVYMYGLRKFTRVKSELAQVERFVTEVSGNGLSTRDIQLLCDAYFSGNDDMREQVHAGNINWTLKMLKKNNASGESILSTLDRLQELMNTINTKDNETFDHKMLHYLDRLLQRIQGVYAQCRKTGNAPGSLPRGEK